MRPISGSRVTGVPEGEVFAVVTEYIEAKRFDAADRMLGHILKAAPRHPDALHLRGLIAFRRGQISAAADMLEQALALGANRGLHLRNLSEVFRQCGRLDEAAAMARRCIAAQPADPLGPFNLAMVQYDRLEIADCIASARAALALRADLPEAHMKLAQALLISGDYGQGWNEYEWRYRIPGAAALMPVTDRPQWDGSDLGVERLLLIADQGYGDVLMFGRFLAWAQTRTAHITVAGSAEMRDILSQLAPRAEIVVRWDQLPPYAAFCPISGLPRLARIELAQLEGSRPYLAADPKLVASWAARLDQAVPPGKKRVALAWSGRPSHNNDRNRSIKLDLLAPLAAAPDTVFVSLQKGPPATQCSSWPGPAPLLDLDPEIKNFEDSAAILANVDLLVSVDTSLVHLAGASGRPAWVMLPYAPDWRWLLERDDTPWYSSVRLFRQPTPGDWTSVVGRIASAL